MPGSKNFAATRAEWKVLFFEPIARIFVVFLPFAANMKKAKIIAVLLIISLLFTGADLMAQCSICTKTAQQLGEGPAKGMNSGILYLAFAPMAIIGFISFKWYKNHRNKD